jgi:hypothetical protein
MQDAAVLIQTFVNDDWIQPLVWLTASPNAGVHSNAAWAIAQIATSAERQQKVADEGGVNPLIQLLKSDDHEVQAHASWALASVCKDNVRIAAKVGENGDALRLMVKLLGSEDLRVVENATFAVEAVSIAEQNRDILREKGGLIALCKLLDCIRPEVVTHAACSLAWAAGNNAANKKQIQRQSSMPLLVVLLGSPSPAIVANAAFAIAVLAEDSVPGLIPVQEALSAVSALVKCLDKYRNDGDAAVLEKVGFAVASLCLRPRCQAEFAKLGAVQHLVANLSSQHALVQARSAMALASISRDDDANSALVVDEPSAADALVRLLSSSSAIVRAFGAKATMVLTTGLEWADRSGKCSNPAIEQIKSAAVRAGAVRSLVGMLGREDRAVGVPGFMVDASFNGQDLLHDTVYALANISSKVLAKKQIVSSGGVPLLVGLLGSDDDEVCSQAGRALANASAPLRKQAGVAKMETERARRRAVKGERAGVRRSADDTKTSKGGDMFAIEDDAGGDRSAAPAGAAEEAAEADEDEDEDTADMLQSQIFADGLEPLLKLLRSSHVGVVENACTAVANLATAAEYQSMQGASMQGVDGAAAATMEAGFAEVITVLIQLMQGSEAALHDCAARVVAILVHGNSSSSSSSSSSATVAGSHDQRRHERVRKLAAGGGVSVLIALLVSTDSAARENAAWALAGVAKGGADAAPWRDLILAEGGVEALSALVANEGERGEHSSTKGQHLLGMMTGKVRDSDSNPMVLVKAARAVGTLLLSEAVQERVLEQEQAISGEGLLSTLNRLLHSRPEPRVRKNVLRALSNACAGGGGSVEGERSVPMRIRLLVAALQPSPIDRLVDFLSSATVARSISPGSSSPEQPEPEPWSRVGGATVEPRLVVLATELLRNLGAEDSNKLQIVEAGAIPVLFAVCDPGGEHPESIASAERTVARLALEQTGDCAAQIFSGGGVGVLSALVLRDEINVRLGAVEALGNLSLHESEGQRSTIRAAIAGDRKIVEMLVGVLEQAAAVETAKEEGDSDNVMEVGSPARVLDFATQEEATCTIDIVEMDALVRLVLLAISRLASERTATTAVYKNDGLSPIVALLQSPDTEVARLCCACVSQLAFGNESVKADLQRMDTNHLLVQLVITAVDEVREPAAVALGSMADGSATCARANRREIVEFGGVRPLVALLRKEEVVTAPAQAGGDEASGEDGRGLWDEEGQRQWWLQQGIEALALVSRLRASAAYALGNLAHGSRHNQALIAGKRAVPLLLDMLSPPEHSEVKWRSCWALANLAQLPANKILLAQQGAVDVLTRLVSSDEESAVQRYSCMAISYACAGNDENKAAVAACGVIPALCGMLRDGDDAVVEQAALAIAKLAMLEPNRAIVGRAGGIRALAKLLEPVPLPESSPSALPLSPIRSPSSPTKATGERPLAIRKNAISAIANLCMGDDENKVEIGAIGAIPSICALLGSHNGMVLESAATALAQLAIDNENKAIIAKHCELVRFTEFLSSPNRKMQEMGALALRHLSLNDRNKMMLGRDETALELMVEALDEENRNVLEGVVHTLANLSFNEANKLLLVAAGAAGALVNLLPRLRRAKQEGAEGVEEGDAETDSVMAGSSEYYGEDSTISLGATSTYSVASADSIVDPLAHGAAGAPADFNPDQERNIVEQTVLCVANLATLPTNRTQLATEGCIPLLVPLLTSASVFLQKCTAWALVNLCNKHDANQQEATEAGAVLRLISLMQSDHHAVIETSAWAASVLAQHGENAVYMASNRALHLINDLLRANSSERVLERVARLLGNLVDVPSVRDKAIAQGDVLPLLVRLLRQCTGTLSHADRVLKNVTRALVRLLGSAELKRGFPSEEGVPPLVTLLHSPHEKVQRNAAQALAELSLHEPNRETIARLEGLPPLVALLASAHLAVVEAAAFSLSRLSMRHENKQQLLVEGVVPLLLPLLSSTEPALELYATRTVASLAAGGPELKHAIALEGGVPPLLAKLDQFFDLYRTPVELALQLRERGHAFLVLHNATLALAHLASYDTADTTMATNQAMLEQGRPNTAGRPATAGAIRPSTVGLLGTDKGKDTLRLLGLLQEAAQAHLGGSGNNLSGAAAGARQRQRWVQLTIAEEGGIQVLGRALGVLGPAAFLRPLSAGGGAFSSRPMSGGRAIVSSGTSRESGRAASHRPHAPKSPKSHAPKGPGRRPVSNASSATASVFATDTAANWTMGAVYGSVEAPTSVGTVIGVDAPRSIESVGAVDAPESLGAVSAISAMSARSGNSSASASDEAAFAAHSRLEENLVRALASLATEPRNRRAIVETRVEYGSRPNSASSAISGVTIRGPSSSLGWASADAGGGNELGSSGSGGVLGLLVQRLESRNEVVLNSSVMALGSLSTVSTNKPAICEQQPRTVPLLLQLLHQPEYDSSNVSGSETSSAWVLACASWALANLIYKCNKAAETVVEVDSAGCATVVALLLPHERVGASRSRVVGRGGVSAAMSMLGPRVQEFAAWACASLAHSADVARAMNGSVSAEQVGAGAKANTALVMLLATHDERVQAKAARALGRFAAAGQRQLSIQSGGSIHLLVLLCRSSDPRVRKNAAFALSHMARDESCRMGIADFGGVGPLVSLLQPQVPPFAAALAALASDADSADVATGTQHSDPTAVATKAIGKTTIRATQYALSALASLAQVPDYQVLVGLEGGNELLVWLLVQCTHVVESLEQRSRGQAEEQDMQPVAETQAQRQGQVDGQGSAWLVSQLAQARAVRQETTGLLALVSAHSSNKAALHDSGAVGATAQLLLVCTDPILLKQQGGNTPQVYFTTSSSSNGARWRLLRAALLTLANLAPHSASVQAAIAREGGLGRIVQAGLLTLSAKDVGFIDVDEDDRGGMGAPGSAGAAASIAAAIRTSAVLVVAHASAHEGNKALVAASGAIPVLMSLLAGADTVDSSEVVIEGALLGLAYLSTRNESNKSKMVALMSQVAGRQRLLSLLQRKLTGSRVAALAAWVVANLCTFNDEYRDAFVQEGAMEPLVALLASSNDGSTEAQLSPSPPAFHLEDAQRYGAWAISNLTNSQPANQQMAADCGAMPRLVALLRNSSNESVRLNAVLALAKLSALPSNAALVIDEGGAHVLAHLLDRPVRGQLGEPTQGQTLGQTLGQTAHGIVGANPVLLENVLLTLSQLASGPVVRHKEEIAACGALVPLVALLSAGILSGTNSSGSSSVRYYAALTLARLAEAGRNVKSIGGLNAVAPLIRLLRSGSSSRPSSADGDSACAAGHHLHPLDPTAAAALSALAHLSGDPDNTVAIAVDDGVSHAVALLAACTTPTAAVSGSAQQLDTLLLLRNLSESAEVRVIVASEGALPSLVQLLLSSSGNEELQEHCVRIIANMSELPPVSEALADESNDRALEHLVQLLSGDMRAGTTMVEHSLHVLANVCSQDGAGGDGSQVGGRGEIRGGSSGGSIGENVAHPPVGMRRLSIIKPADAAGAADAGGVDGSYGGTNKQKQMLLARARAKEQVLSYGVIPPLRGLLRSKVEAVQQHAATLAAVLCRKSAVCCAELSGLGSLAGAADISTDGSIDGPLALVELLMSNDLRTRENGAWALASLAEFEASADAAARAGAVVACAQLLDAPTAGGRARGKAARCLTRLCKWEQKRQQQGVGLGLGADGVGQGQAPQGSVLAMAERGGLVPSLMQALCDGAAAMAHGTSSDTATSRAGAKLQKNALGLLMQLAQTQSGCEAIGAMSQQNPQHATGGQQGSRLQGRGLTVELNRMLRIVQAQHSGGASQIGAYSSASVAKVQLYTLSLLLQLASYPKTCRHMFAAGSAGGPPQSASSGHRSMASMASASSLSVLPELALLAQSAPDGIANQALGVVKRLLTSSEECRCSADAIHALAPALIEIIRSHGSGQNAYTSSDDQDLGFTTRQQEAVACLNCMMHANPSREALRAVLAAHMPMGAQAQDLQLSWLWLAGAASAEAFGRSSAEAGTARMQLLVNVCVADGGRNNAVLHGALEDTCALLEAAEPGDHALAAASEAVAVLCAGLDSNRHLQPGAGPDLFHGMNSHQLSGGGLGTSGAAVRQHLHAAGATTQLLKHLAEPSTDFYAKGSSRSPKRPQRKLSGNGSGANWAAESLRDGDLALTAPYIFAALLELAVLPEARQQIAENTVVISSALNAVLESLPRGSAIGGTGGAGAGTAGGTTPVAGGGRVYAARLCELLAKFEGNGVRGSMGIMDITKALEKLASRTHDDEERAAAKEALVWASAGTSAAMRTIPILVDSGVGASPTTNSRISPRTGEGKVLDSEIASDVEHLRRLLLLVSPSSAAGAGVVSGGNATVTAATEAGRRLVGRVADPAAVKAMAAAGVLPVLVGVLDFITTCWSSGDTMTSAPRNEGSGQDGESADLTALLAADAGRSLVASAIATADALCAASVQHKEEAVRVGMTAAVLHALVLQSAHPSASRGAANRKGSGQSGQDGDSVAALLRLLCKLSTVEASLRSFTDSTVAPVDATSPGPTANVKMVANMMLEPHHPAEVVRLSTELLASLCGGTSGAGARAISNEVGAGAFISVLRAAASLSSAGPELPFDSLDHKLGVQLAGALALERILALGQSGTLQAIREDVLELGGVSELVVIVDGAELDASRFAPSSIFAVQRAAVSALAHLCTSDDAGAAGAGVVPPPPEGSVAEAMVAVAIESGLQPLVALFHCPEPSVVAQACRLTVELCKHPGVRELFLAEGGVIKMCSLLERKPSVSSRAKMGGKALQQAGEYEDAQSQVRRYALAVLAELSKEPAVQAEMGEDEQAVEQCMDIVVSGASVLSGQAGASSGSSNDPDGMLLLLEDATRTIANLSWFEANKVRIGRGASGRPDEGMGGGVDQLAPGRNVVALLELLTCELQLQKFGASSASGAVVAENAVLALANASTVPSVKALVVGHGGVHRLVGLLKNAGGQQHPLSGWMLKCTVWCLAILCHKQPKACQMTVAAGGVPALIALCQLQPQAASTASSSPDADEHTTQTTQECAAWCLAAIALLPTGAGNATTLSSDTPNTMDAPRRMVEAGAVVTLLSLFSSRSSRVRSKACRALGNLFACAGTAGEEARRAFDERADGGGDVIDRLVQVLRKSAEDPEDVAAKNALRALCVLCESDTRALYLQKVANSGLTVVLTFLLHPSPKVQAQCASLAALLAGAAADNGGRGELVLESMVQQGAAPALLQLLRSSDPAEATADPPAHKMSRTVERAAACLAFLSAAEANKEPLTRAGVIAPLLGLLRRVSLQMRSRAMARGGQPQQPQELPPRQDTSGGVAELERVQEFATKVLANLSTASSGAGGGVLVAGVLDPQTQAASRCLAIADEGGVPQLVGCLMVEGGASEAGTRRNALFTLVNLASQQRAKARISEAGGVPPLVNILQATPTSAAAAAPPAAPNAAAAAAAAAGDGSSGGDMRQYALLALACLSSEPDVQHEMVAEGIIPTLVELLRDTTDKSAQANAAWAVANLASDAQHRSQLTSAGAMQVLRTMGKQGGEEQTPGQDPPMRPSTATRRLAKFAPMALDLMGGS